MLARIYLQLRRRSTGRKIPVRSFGPDGLVLDDDGDTFPRSAMLKLRANNRVTKKKLERVGRSSRGLHPYVSQGRLALRALAPDDLPSGSYRFKLFIEDLDVSSPSQGYRVEVGSLGAVALDLPIGDDDPRELDYPNGVGGFDPRIQEVLDASKIDGLPARTWLTTRIRRPRRKACLLNLLAKLTATPSKGGTLVRSLREVIYAGPDRAYFRVDEDFHRKVSLMAKDTPPVWSFVAEGRPRHACHFRLPERVSNRTLSAAERDALALHSYRERSRPALQVITFPRGDVSTPDYAELDIDLGNPLLDLVGFVTHMGELVSPAGTDHFDVHRRLARNKSVQPLLGYRVAIVAPS